MILGKVKRVDICTLDVLAFSPFLLDDKSFCDTLYNFYIGIFATTSINLNILVTDLACDPGSQAFVPQVETSKVLFLRVL